MRVTTAGAGALNIDGRTLDSTTTLSVQPSGGQTSFGGQVNVAGQVVAANTWYNIYENNLTFGQDSGGIQSLSIGVDGYRQRAFKIVLSGLLQPGSGVDSRIFVRINGAGSGYRGYIVMDGDANPGKWDTCPGVYRVCTGTASHRSPSQVASGSCKDWLFHAWDGVGWVGAHHDGAF